MNLQDYKKKRAELHLQQRQYRSLCSRCIQPNFACYCAHIAPFDPLINFVVLIHPIEVKRRIATGRMSHLSLKNSYLIKGQDYTNDRLVNDLIEDPSHQSMILYPGASSCNLSHLNNDEKQSLFAKNKKLRIFVIDGTWATARKMIRLSQNLKSLPRICFSPGKPSNFRVRKQPNSHCYSTIEAIHHTIELVGEVQGFCVKDRTHDRLLTTFNYMVERQLTFIEESHRVSTNTYRRETSKSQKKQSA